MENKINFNNNILFFNNKNIYTFKYDIGKVITDWDDVIIVLTNCGGQKFPDSYRNVFCVDYNGNLIWRIKEYRPYPELKPNSTTIDWNRSFNYWVDIEVNKDENSFLELFNLDNDHILIDPYTQELKVDILEFNKDRGRW